MRMRRKPKLESRVDMCAHLLITHPESLRGRWREEFQFGELHVELGCGKGRFTVETAQCHPEVFFVALEKLTNVMVVALERAVNDGFENIRFINGLADNFAAFFGVGEVSRIYINFCDPWPANRHAKRRLTGQRFLEMYKQVLKLNGEIHFKTDDLPLFDYSLGEFERCGFKLSEVTRDLHANGQVDIMTDYEDKFHQQGKPIFQCLMLNV